MDSLSEANLDLNEREQFAFAQGIDPQKSHAYKLELDVLRNNGLLVDLDISGTSMFSRAATWLELGVQDATTQSRFTKGRKSLIPDEVEKRLKSIETRMRQILEKYSYPTKGFYPYRWIPWTAYPKWRSEMDRLLDDFASVKSEIISNLDSYIDIASGDFAMIARSAWRAIVGRGYEHVILAPSQIASSEDELVDWIVAGALQKFPTVDEIEKRLIADYSTAFVYGEQDIAADQMAAEIIQAQKQAAVEAAYSQSAMLSDQARHQLKMNQMEEQAKEIQIEAMRTAEIEHARKRIQEIGSPFADVLMQLRNRVAEDAEAMLASIQKNGYVRGKIAEKGRSLIEFYKLMAVHSDTELRNLLERLTAEIGPEGSSPAERNSEQIAGTLAEIVNLTHVTAEEMMTVSQAAFIEI